MEPTDSSIIECALRETHEEIAMGKTCVDVLGLWHDTYNKKGDTAVTPVVAFCGELDMARLAPNADEVCVCVCVCVCLCNSLSFPVILSMPSSFQLFFFHL